MVDVYVIGEGPVELAAALEFAEVGLSVRVGRAASPAPVSGGAAREAGRAGDADACAAGFSPGEVTDPDGTLREFLEHVAAPLSPGGAPLAAARPVATPPAPVLLRGADRVWRAQPTPAVFGIPAVPLSRASIALLGGGGAARAFLDRVRPLLTIGKTRSLGALVRSRLGGAALERLVDPFVRAKYGVDAERVDVAIAAPGLNEDLTTAGSLCGAALAYAERHVARETRVRPAGGWPALRDALLERLALYGVEVAEAPATGVASAARDGAGAAGEPDAWLVSEAGGQVRASAVVLGDRAAGLPGVPDDARAHSPRAVRWIAELDVATPDFARSAAADRADIASPAAALEIVMAPNGERWSAAWERDAAGGPAADAGWRLRLSGPAGGRADGPSSDASDAEVRDTVGALVRAVLEGAEPGEGSAAASIRLVPALFATAAARDEAIGHTTSPRAGESTCLRVGPEVHSGDLAAAVSDAREKSVHLRRRLTGIAE
ncbi:hypothetical protein [Leucobacter chromiiresistens]|uniref:Oxygen-dependent protoporphyrinogen oxidase n=2 Tax=Leucobacter chromiiresistens TaxID=1079994 RepID=A0A1H0YDK4_9MICO|nr:hypothetical protein [Leucobacter chromiiresistens]SDQ13021.1 hypothetical protein SAMN04488565_0759 [Leucobacter chromiiresistens]